MDPAAHQQHNHHRRQPPSPLIDDENLLINVVDPLEQARREVLALMDIKSDIERRYTENLSVLELNQIGLSERLVDAEGFPRADIDVMAVRTARHNIICLKNDLNHVVKQIDQGMEQYFSERQNSNPNPDTNDRQIMVGRIQETMTDSIIADRLPQSVECEPAFLKVNFVNGNSPAEKCGLRLNDEIIKFGTINSGNFNNDINQVAALIQRRKNHKIPLLVMDPEKRVRELILIPEEWAGRGLLGCNIVICDQVDR